MRASDRKKSHVAEESIPLTSLMDAMTIILLFLLQSFSTDGNLIKKDEDSELAQSLANEKTKNNACVVVTPTEVKFKMDLQKDFNAEWTTQLTPEMLKDTVEFVLPNLLKGLKLKAHEIEELEKALKEQQVDEGYLKEQVRWTVLVEVDKKTKYQLLTKIMATCGEAGFSDIKLLSLGK